MQVRARYRPHPRGFGFLTPVADDGLTSTTVRGPDGSAADADRVFAAPALARQLVADDLVNASVSFGEKGAAAEDAVLVARPRRLVVGVIEQRRGGLVIEPDRALGTGWIGVAAGLADTVAANVGEQVVVLLDSGQGGPPTARALVAGPYQSAGPDAVRARAVVVVLGGAAPSLTPGGAASVALNPVAAETAHVRLMGQLAGGRPGAAAGLDRSGPVPGAGLEPIDRRDEPCVTVDAASSRELDDAVAASWDGDPRSPVWLAVHITDVAGVVGLDSPADHYARTMAATAYLASARNAPMLDPELSEGSRSLVVGQDRPVLSVRLAVLPDGRVDDVAVEAAVIRSRARLTYGAVEQWLAGETKRLRLQASTQADTAEAVVRPALEAARRLGVEREARMTLEELFDQPEIRPAVVDGRISTVSAEPHARAYRLIERLMVAANEAVGGWLVDRGIPALYRAHEGVDAQGRQRLRAAADLVGVSVPSLDAEHGDPGRVSGELLAEAERLAAEGREEDRALLVATATSSTARASYDPEPSHHRGLAARAYCHFTSPLRRYADLVIHRQVRAALAAETPPYRLAELGPLAAWLSVRAGALSRLDARERGDLWVRLLEQGDVTGPELATVVGLTRAGLRIRLPRLGLTGFLVAEQVTDTNGGQRATLDVDEHGLATRSGEWRVGTRVRVRFAGLDELGRANWELVGTPGG